MREIGKFVKIAYFFFGKAQLCSFNGKLSLELDAVFHFSFIKKKILRKTQQISFQLVQSQSWVRNRDNEAVGKCRVFVALYANEKSLIQRQKVTIARGAKSSFNENNKK